jgi:hypothetical protein
MTATRTSIPLAASKDATVRKPVVAPVAGERAGRAELLVLIVGDCMFASVPRQPGVGHLPG